MSSNKTIAGFLSVCFLIFTFPASADDFTLPTCPPNISLLQDTEGKENTFFMAEDGHTLVTRKVAYVYLSGFGFYMKRGDSVSELAPVRNSMTESEYVFGRSETDQVLFACGYSGGALFFHALPDGITSCTVKDNLKDSRSVICQ